MFVCQIYSAPLPWNSGCIHCSFLSSVSCVGRYAVKLCGILHLLLENARSILKWMLMELFFFKKKKKGMLIFLLFFLQCGWGGSHSVSGFIRFFLTKHYLCIVHACIFNAISQVSGRAYYYGYLILSSWLMNSASLPSLHGFLISILTLILHLHGVKIIIVICQLYWLK